MDNPDELWVQLENVVDHKITMKGLLTVNVVPTNVDGRRNFCLENKFIDELP